MVVQICASDHGEVYHAIYFHYIHISIILSLFCRQIGKRRFSNASYYQVNILFPFRNRIENASSVS